MKTNFKKLTLGLMLLMPASGAQSQIKAVMTEPTTTRQIPLEDFFRNPEKTSYQISPDGKHFSYLAPWENRMNIFVQPVAGGNALQITQVKDRDIAGYLWASNNRILYLKDNGGDENFALYGVDLDGKNLKALTAFDNVRTEMIDDLENDDDHIIVGLNKRDARIFDPYRLDINSGKLEMLAENPGNISSWMCDHDGKLRVATTNDGVNTSVLYRDTESSEWQTLVTTNFRENLSPLFFAFDNKNLYCTSNIGRDKNAIILFDVASKREVKVLFEHPEVDVYNLSYSRKRKVLTGISYTVEKTERLFLDELAEQNYNKIMEQLDDDLEVAIVGVNKEENTFIVRTYSDRSLGEYYTYNSETGELVLIEKVSPWINAEEMCNMEPLTYESRDGLIIHAYLTIPKNALRTNLPVVINPHGGPWARDSWGYNPEVQFLANRGYAVFQMNFRGSVGYGRSFWESSFREWGKKMQDDITDGVNWLIAKGIADPDRIAIYGGSYGGYAALAGLTFTPDLYACGIDYVGVSNLFTFMETIPPYWEPYLDMMYEMVGHPEKDKELLASASPVMHAEKIKVPVLIAQGAKDPRVNIAESDQIVEALKKNNVDYEYLVEPEEGHGFQNEENRFKFYRAMENFLAQHLMKK